MHANLMDKQTLAFSELRTKEILSGGISECPAHAVLKFPNLFNRGNFSQLTADFNRMDFIYCLREAAAPC